VTQAYILSSAVAVIAWQFQNAIERFICSMSYHPDKYHVRPFVPLSRFFVTTCAGDENFLASLIKENHGSNG